MMSGTKDGNFRSYLGRKGLKTLEANLGKANEFIKSEEFERTSNTRIGDFEITKEEKRGGTSKKKTKEEVDCTIIPKGKENKEKCP